MKLILLILLLLPYIAWGVTATTQPVTTTTLPSPYKPVRIQCTNGSIFNFNNKAEYDAFVLQNPDMECSKVQ